MRTDAVGGVAESIDELDHQAGGRATASSARSGARAPVAIEAGESGGRLPSL